MKTYTSIWVRAGMSPVFEERKVKRQIGTRPVEKRKGLFNSETHTVDEPIFETVTERVPTGKYSDTQIDIADLSKRIAKACNDLDESGYDVVKISDITQGRYSYQAVNANQASGVIQGGYGYGFGYSLTDGVVIIGKRRSSP